MSDRFLRFQGILIGVLMGKMGSMSKQTNKQDEISSSTLPAVDGNMHPQAWDKLVRNAQEASEFLKAISHEGRLMILCHLSSGEKSVTDLEDLLSSRQSAVSQQLTRLRLEGLVKPRREGKTIYYSLADDRPKKIMEVVYELFCK